VYYLLLKDWLTLKEALIYSEVPTVQGHASVAKARTGDDAKRWCKKGKQTQMPVVGAGIRIMAWAALSRLKSSDLAATEQF
jgi:hypothetical protein